MRITAFVTVLLTTSSLLAQGQAINLNWSCPHTQNAQWPSTIPTEKKISLKLIVSAEGKYKAQSAELTGLLAAVQSSPIDASLCMQDLLKSIRAEMKKLCTKGASNSSPCAKNGSFGLRPLLSDIRRAANENESNALRPLHIESPDANAPAAAINDCLPTATQSFSSLMAGIQNFIQSEAKPAETCVLKLLREAVKSYENSFPPVLGCEKNRKRCQEYLALQNKARLKMEELVELAFGKEMRGVFEESLCRNTKSPLAAFKDLHKHLEQIEECRELKPGEQRTVGQPYTKSSTRIDRLYSVERDTTDPQRYSIKVPINILPTPDLSPEEVVGYKQRLKECLSTTHGKMLGANNEDLRIELDFENSMLGERHSVALNRTEIRANSITHSLDLDCPVMTHEVLHLLGLCDEYRETLMGYVVDESGQSKIVDNLAEAQLDSSPAFDCRFLGPKESIMHDQYEAFNATFGKKTTTLCHKANRFPCVEGASEEALTNFLQDENWYSKSIEIAPKRKSLLEPAHARVILFPNCEQLSGRYSTCARFSRLTSEKAGGKGCGSVPDFCKEKEWLK